jgi:DNA (cytosine-5)-methyltransferase 1
MNKLKVLELFAGIGSQAKALRNLCIEFESDICEFDDKAVVSYNAIHGGVA